MKLLVLIGVLLVVLAAWSPTVKALEIEEEGDALDIDDSVENVESNSDWQKLVMDSGSAFIVGFSESAQVAGSDDTVRSMLSQVGSKTSQYGVKTAHVDCGIKANKKVCQAAMLKNIPHFAFVTDAPELNPYNKKMHRAMTAYDGPPSDIKTVERRFAKNYPGADSIQVLSSVTEVPSKEAAIVVSSSKSSLALYTKSVCYAFRSVKCYQVSNPDAEEAAAKFGIDAEAVPDSPWVAYVSNEGKWSLAPPVGSDVTPRASHLEHVSRHSGLEAEAMPTADKENSNNGKKKQDKDINGVPVDSIEASAFDGELDAQYAWVVGVSTADQAEDKESRAIWKKAINSCEGVIRPIQLLCPTEETSSDTNFGAKLCKRRELPFLAVLPRYGPDAAARVTAEKLQVFDAADVASAKKAAQMTLDEDAVMIIGEADVDFVLRKATEERKAAVIVLSDKETPPSMLSNLALALDNYSIISFLSEPSGDFLAKVGGVQTLPAVLCAIPQNEAEVQPGQPAQHQIMMYDASLFGPIKYLGMQNFILSAYQRSGLMEERQAEQAQDREPAADVSGEVQTEMYTVPVEADWMKHCSTSYRGLCVLGLTRHDETAAAEDSAVLEQAMKHMGKQAAAFTFMTTDGACQTTFSARFDVDVETLPRVVAYSPAKKRYMTLSGNMDEANVVSFLTEVLSGKVASSAIPQRPEMSAECEYQDWGDVTESVDDADADDFLAEIRREEEEAKAALKKELEAEKKAASAAKAAAEEAAKKPKTIKKVVKKKGKKKKAKTEL
jgi:hypothetical protein